MTTPHHALTQRVTVLRVDRIEPHPANVRESLGVGDLADLAKSIRRHGILQPLTVTPQDGGRYQLVAGHRRLAAAQRAGLAAVPAIIRHGVTDTTALELMLVENCQRRDLNPVERAEAYGALLRRGRSQAEIATETGVSQSTVSYFLALLDLDDKSREQVRSGKLTASEAVRAVRRTRRKTRKAKGPTAAYKWEPDYLTASHPLARRAARLCEADQHTMRRRIGAVACGQCWETAIRTDERTVAVAGHLLSGGER